jgi:hypothetical protein
MNQKAKIEIQNWLDCGLFDGLSWCCNGEWWLIYSRYWWVQGKLQVSVGKPGNRFFLDLSADNAAPHFGPAKMSGGDATSRGQASGATERLRRALCSGMPALLSTLQARVGPIRVNALLFIPFSQITNVNTPQS